jgi:hypothetical protein
VAERIGDVVMRTHDDGSVDVIEAPVLALIGDELLANLHPSWLDPSDPDVLRLADSVRYRLGEHRPDLRGRLLHRI